MIGHSSASTEQISFGSFRLYPTQQLLLEGGKHVRLGSRARDILITLLERPGQLIGKEELIARVWPNTFVEEGNLKVHVAALRKALGDGHAGNRYITNVPGRGYCFVAPIAISEEQQVAVPPPEPGERPQDFPPPLTRMVGRSEITVSVATHLLEHRFVTIVGPGGIGKTTVALAVADSSIARFKDRVYFVDLAALSDPALVPSALASALGIAVRSENPTDTLVSFLKDKEVLLVLDSCEHVIEAAASVAESIFSGARRTHILATSREPLRVEGERVHSAASPREPTRVRSHYGRRSAHVPRGPALCRARCRQPRRIRTDGRRRAHRRRPLSSIGWHRSGHRDCRRARRRIRYRRIGDPTGRPLSARDAWQAHRFDAPPDSHHHARLELCTTPRISSAPCCDVWRYSRAYSQWSSRAPFWRAMASRRRRLSTASRT